MTRFYRFQLSLVVAAAIVLPRFASAQSGPRRSAPPAPAAAPPSDTDAVGPIAPLIGTALPSRVLDDLPASGNLLSLIDALAADVISDRVDTGGLTPGSAARIGGHGSSWTQTRYFLDGIDVTDPDGSGTPFLLPGVLEWDRVDVRTGAMPIDIDAVGLAVSLRPRRPTREWTGRVDALGSRSLLVSGAAVDLAPTISHLNSYANGSFLVSGPLVANRVGIVAAGSWVASSRFDRTDPTELSSSLGSLFAHVVFNPDDRSEGRLIAWVQRAGSPSENRIALNQALASETGHAAHAQLAWDRRLSEERTVSAHGSFSIRERTPDLTAPAATFMDRVFEGPVTSLVYPGFGTDRRWSLGAQLQPASATAKRWAGLRAGLEVSGGSAEVRPAFSGTVGESTNGLPARVWAIATTTTPSHWGETTLSVYASDRIDLLPRVGVEVGGRFEAVRASADGSADSISWQTFLPRAGLRWAMLDWKRISAFVNYGRSAYQLPLDALAWGDPNAATGSVYRWNASAATHDPLPREIGALIQRVGPGTGATGLSSIDPGLARPYIDEMTFGFEGHPNAATLVRLSAIARRERQLLGVVDTGVPASAYTVSFVPDPGVDLASSRDDQQLAVYSRPASTFGLDRYLLTNPADNNGTFVGVDVSIQSQTDRLFFVLAGTAGRVEALAANRGFLATENDEGLLGELYIDPNARTFAQGRTFTERGYTIKTAGTYRFDHDIRVGVTARYQDGQHFARLVIAPGLTQGAEAIRAFRNGRTRFTYTMTVDARLQKGFEVQGYNVAALLDVYNLFNQHTEIEEYPISGVLSRTTTAIQPPRAVHVGVRVSF